MAKVLGIIISEGSRIRVKGLKDYRPIGAFSFLGRYRVVDFPLSNMSNSGIDRIHVYAGKNPRSLVEHVGSGRHYNINSKSGGIEVLFSEAGKFNDVYDTDVQAINENLSVLQKSHREYVVLAPSYMVYAQDYKKALKEHIASGADISVLYHQVSTAKEDFLNSKLVDCGDGNVIRGIVQNLGNEATANVSMATYIMKRTQLMTLIKDAIAFSSGCSLSQIIHEKCRQAQAGAPDALVIKAIRHEGFFADCRSLRDYVDANMDLLDMANAESLFRPEWPIYTRTTDTCPSKYYESAVVKNSMISNGCIIKGTVENSVIGRSVTISEGAIVKNCIISAYVNVGEGVRLEGQVIDKWAKIVTTKEIVTGLDNPGYIKRDDTL